VRRRKKNADGTYAPSESYHSGDSDFYDKVLDMNKFMTAVKPYIIFVISNLVHTIIYTVDSQNCISRSVMGHVNSDRHV
jgi:hypothetical protein